MDQNSENSCDFESLLKNRSAKRPLALYTSSEHKNKVVNSAKTVKISALEVLANVSRQVRALQNADTVNNKRVGNTLDKYKKREFLPVNMMPVERVVLQQPTKFETQCVTDTQLINVIESAEIVDKNRVVTQEFDETFCENGDNDINDKLNGSRLKPETKTDTGIGTAPEIMNIDRNNVLEEHDGLNEQDSKLFENSDLVTCEMDTITCYQNEVMADFNDDVNTTQEIQGFNKRVEIFDVSEDHADRPVSPVLNTNRKSSTPPLVVDLYTFEKFENLAIPIIEEHGDLTIAKNMINSQIIGREILIPAHSYDNFGRYSPVLSKIDCITTHLNQEDGESICTCSNNFIEKNVKFTNEPTTEHINLTSENKKTQPNIVKTEIKDEILFSSDEEYEYLHKNIQDLPLTCALETSFYDKSDVLDKTMYVGFHTASNKSIQINTDSFTRAKSMLGDVDNKETGTTFSDLVEIFDTGKAVSEHTQSVKLTLKSSKIEHSHENLERSSKTLNEFEEKRDDTFESISLTALQQEKEVNDDIVMSQIINSKSIPNSIMSEGKVSDTFDNIGSTVLEQNEETDDDIMMSQVITFKSISRTPKFAPNVSHESSQLSKVIAKRKLEGFKTASNKKIKLSNKALARCKKVFQDIDLGNSEYESSESNFAEMEEVFHENFKSHEFSSSNDASKTRCEQENDQEREKDISDNIENNTIISEDSESDLQVKEKQPGIEDLQINDQTILKEFEENEMPLEETNNNACVKKASCKNMFVSGVAIAATKNVFKDILSVTTTINTDCTMNTADSFIDRSDKCENVFKKPATELRKAATKRTKTWTDCLTNIKSGIPDTLPLKQEDDDETCDTWNPPKEFIGFKTASHKEIIISEQAREKTIDFYRHLDEEITPNVHKDGTIYSNTGMKNINKLEDEFNCGIDTQDFLAEELIHIEELLKDNIVENEKPISPIFQGFQTASKKAIEISEKALEKSKKLFEDITYKECDFKCHLTKQNEQEHGYSSKIEKQKSKDTHTDQSFDNESQFTAFLANSSNKTCPLANMRNKTSVFTGFQTASNKKVSVSKKGIEAIKILFQDNERLTELNRLETVDNNVENPETLLKHNNHIFHDLKLSGNIQDDFSENSTTLSELQPDNSKVANSENTNTKAHMLAEFKTASAKPLRVSADATDRPNNFVKGIKDVDLFDTDFRSTSDPKPSISRFVGFQTASNKKINISAKSLAKSKQLLNDFELKDKNTDNDDGDKKISHSFDIHFEDETVTFKENDLNNKLRPSSSKFVGFKTASNQAVNISKEALAKSKQIFQDVDIFDNESETLGEVITTADEKSSPVFKGFQTANKNKVSISEKALQKSKKLLHDAENCNFPDNAPVFQGFQTASNKKVNISEEAIANSNKLYEDINSSQFNTDPKTAVISNGMHMNKATAKDIIDNVKDTIVSNHENKFDGFQTASNKTVKVSERALAKTKDMFADIHVEQGNDDSAPVLRGFQTASNKHVYISEKALAKSKKLFEDINLSQLNADPKTAVQKGVINDIKAPIINNHEIKFAGFQTASNNKVMVSDQALAKTKSIFKDIDIEEENDILINDKAPVFKGFQTASNKNVAVSEKALAKSKKLFEDINFSQIEDPAAKTDLNRLQITKKYDVIDNKEKPDNVNENKNNFGGFQTASNKKVKISEQALAKTKDVFKELHIEKENDSHINVREIKTPDLKANVNLIISKKNNFIPIESKIDANIDVNGDVIDTQVLNDFESTLNTEHFCKRTPVSKRSGSPILSCPRAKKRKFETPYRTSKKIEPRNAFVPPKLARTYNFIKDYKKHKKYSLKDVEKLEKEYKKVDIDPCISEVNFDGLINFVFNGKRNDYTDGKMTTEDLKKTFLDSVNKKIVPEGWLDNHIKLITWKLLSYEVKFPNLMKNTCTVRNVLEQLKYRHDRELYHVERPILRKILEKDEVPSKTMVLCVAAIYVDNVSVTSVPPPSQNVELLLTDGWYCVRACLDRMLIRLVVSEAIVVGTKIAVCGAELINCEQGIAPWEDTSSVRLKLHGNSTRRARWLSPLGPRTDVIPCGLGAARADGGKAAVVRLALTRVYPVLTVERMDGSTVTLSERLENIRQMKYESERQAITEKLYEEVEKEMPDLESQDSEGNSEKGCMDTGSQVAKCMMKCNDPDEYGAHLTKSQSRMLEDHNSRQRDKLAERVRERFQEKLQKYGLKTERNVVQLVKVRVADFTEKTDSVEVTKGYLSIWRPSAAVLELVREGAWLEILNVIPTGIRNSEIQLSTGRQTVFNPYKQTNEKFNVYANTLQRKCYEIKEIAQNPSMTTDYNEIDTVGMIFCIEPSTKDFHEQSFQNVYLADADKNMVCVNFWGGLKKFGYENVLDTGQIITCVNLQKRAGNTRKSIPQYRVTELSYFTKTPKSKKALEITNELTNKLSKSKDKFCEDCIILKNNYSIFKTRNNETVSPYRFDYNIPKNVSPGCDANLNLTGLDFESSFNSQDISPQALLRKRKVNEKIEKLRLNYGEPPPLSSIQIINKSKNASATYKSPLISNLERTKSPLRNVASPVTVNRTFVKIMNPVKLDFSNDLNESADQFAEDFDASPPLSLDSDVVYK